MSCAILVIVILGVPVLAFAAKPGDSPLPPASHEDLKIHIIDGHHPNDGRLDEFRIVVVCADGNDKLDLGIPKRWASFLINHLDAQIEFDDEGVDLELLWQTLEDLRPGEEIRIDDRDGSEVRIWLE